MDLYAVCLNTAQGWAGSTAEAAEKAQRDYPDDFWIEFYWAEDSDHAEEQAEDAHQGCAVVCVARAPSGYVLDPEVAS